MNNFVYHNPTKLVFGKGQIAQLAKLIPAGKKIMITFGGGSVRRNGIYDQVVKALEGRDWVEFWGIEPNPSVETVREAIALGREHGSGVPAGRGRRVGHRRYEADRCGAAL